MRWERIDLHARKDARAGRYVLRTSHTARDLERVARTYWQLTEIEATFRSLKSEIGLRPIWHAKQDRIRAHARRPCRRRPAGPVPPCNALPPAALGGDRHTPKPDQTGGLPRLTANCMGKGYSPDRHPIR